MKRSMIKTGAAVLCTALALTLFGNTTDVLAYDGEIPYEDYGIDVSTRSERDQFYDYQEYAIYVKLREAIGDEYTPELSAIFDEAEAAVYSVNYNSTISLEDNKAQIAEIMDYYLALIDEVKNPVITPDTPEIVKPYDSSLTLAENGIDFMDVMAYRDTVQNSLDVYGYRACFEVERDARSYFFEWLIQLGIISSPDDISAVMELANTMRELEYDDSLSFEQNLNRVYAAYRAIGNQYCRDWI